MPIAVFFQMTDLERPEYHYDGELKNGRRNGRGILTWADGEGRYEGDFVDNAFEGQGVLALPNGTHYEGGFRNSRYSGHGVCRYPSGIRLEGEFEDGYAVGPGIVYFTDGTRFEGIFSLCGESDSGSITDENSGVGFHIDAEGNSHPATWVIFRSWTDCSGECSEYKTEYFRQDRYELH